MLTDVPSMFKPGESAKPVVVPGKPETSLMMEAIRTSKGAATMPKGREPLTAKQFQTIETWIKQGAKDDTPASATAKNIDSEHPPVYPAPPVVTAVAYSPDGNILAVSGYHEILLHRPDGSGVVGRLVGLSERVQSLAFSPDRAPARRVGRGPGPVRRNSNLGHDEAKADRFHSAHVRHALRHQLVAGRQTVAVGCADNTVRAVDAMTGKQVLQMGTHSDWVLGTVFSRDGQYLAA